MGYTFSLRAANAMVLYCEKYQPDFRVEQHTEETAQKWFCKVGEWKTEEHLNNLRRWWDNYSSGYIHSYKLWNFVPGVLRVGDFTFYHRFNRLYSEATTI